MNICGLQKLTLLDFPEKVACTVFTCGCNFRCPFCHNASLVVNVETGAIMSNEEVLSFLKKRIGILDGICITGGEPLIQAGLEDFIKTVKDMGYKVKLDTNGSFPSRLKALAGDGLIDYVAMDIKNSPESYAKTVGLKNFDITPVKESVEFLLKGTIPYEFRTTLVREYHTKEDITAIGEWIKGASKYFFQSFMDTGDLILPGLHGFTKEEMEAFKKLLEDKVPTVKLRGV